MRRIALALLCVGLLLAPAARAVTPDEMLADPALEQRARDISAGLRCLVCQNQSIDDSDADLARDLRVLVRERLEAGDSDRQVVDFIVSRYGEFVLLKPRFNVRTVLLWAAPFMLLLAGGAFVFFASRRKRPVEVESLTAEERAALDELLRREPPSQH
ncbi:cytochrome c-type biogenesis protein [Aquamicrobium terrae]